MFLSRIVRTDRLNKIDRYAPIDDPQGAFTFFFLQSFIQHPFNSAAAIENSATIFLESHFDSNVLILSGVPEDVDDLIQGTIQKIVLDALKSGVRLNLEEVVKKFEETRKEAWKEIKEKFVKKVLIE